MKRFLIKAVSLLSCALFINFSCFGSSSNKKSSGKQNGKGFENQVPGEPPADNGMGGPGKPGPGGFGPGNSNIEPDCSDADAKSVTYSFTNAEGVKVTYYAKYLVDGSSSTASTLTLSDATIDCTGSNEIAVLVINGGKATLNNCRINKSGAGTNSVNEDAYNFYGINDGVMAVGSGSELNLNGCSVTTTSEYANAVFATDEGTINISNGITVKTTANSSRGLFASYGGKVFAPDGGVNVSTKGLHCAPLATDRGSGTIQAGSSTSSKASVLSSVANDSPVIYATGTITGFNITGSCKNGQTIVIEGKNIVELTGCTMTGGRTEQGCIFLYQSSSGDASDEDASSSYSSLTIKDCTFIDSNKTGMFVITHTTAKITSSGCKFYYGKAGKSYTASASNSYDASLITCRTVNDNQWGSGSYLTYTTDDALTGSLYCGDASDTLTVNCGTDSKLVKCAESSGKVTVNNSAL